MSRSNFVIWYGHRRSVTNALFDEVKRSTEIDLYEAVDFRILQDATVIRHQISSTVGWNVLQQMQNYVHHDVYIQDLNGDIWN